MRSKHVIAVLVLFAAVSMLAADASAVYHPTIGRFMSRDPGPEGIVAAPRVGGAGPVIGRQFIPRDPRWEYADGMNLYQYAKTNPIAMVDPLGLQGLNLRGNPAGYECCCCCVDNLSITDVATLVYGTVSSAGHTFTVNADLAYKLPDGGGYVKGDCTLKWEERTNMPPASMRHYWQPGTWVDQAALIEETRPWRLRRRPCPGEETVAMTDRPRMEGVADKSARQLDIKVTISSTQDPKCEGKCKNKSLTVSTRQELIFRDGAVVGGYNLRGDYTGPGSYFTVGPVQAQPW